MVRVAERVARPWTTARGDLPAAAEHGVTHEPEQDLRMLHVAHAWRSVVVQRADQIRAGRLDAVARRMCGPVAEAERDLTLLITVEDDGSGSGSAVGASSSRGVVVAHTRESAFWWHLRILLQIAGIVKHALVGASMQIYFVGFEPTTPTPLLQKANTL